MEFVMETHNYIVLQTNRGVGNIPIVLGLSLYFYKLNHEHVFYKSTLIPITETKESELVSKHLWSSSSKLDGSKNAQSRSVKSSDHSPGTCGRCPCVPLPSPLPPLEFWFRSWYREDCDCDCDVDDLGIKGTDESKLDRCICLREGPCVPSGSDAGSQGGDVGKGTDGEGVGFDGVSKEP